jgi:hypothetical protein
LLLLLLVLLLFFVSEQLVYECRVVR